MSLFKYIDAIIRILKREISYFFYIKPPFKSYNNILLYDPSLDTLNAGDHIIMYYCLQIIKQKFKKQNFYHISTHKPKPPRHEYFDFEIVCGTNLLFPKMERQGHWNYPLQYRYLNNICLELLN